MGEAAGKVVDGLRQWAQRRGGALAQVEDLRDLGGHSGETWGFAYCAGAVRAELVIRLAAAGGGERANGELIRQAPLLDALLKSGTKVAPVRDVSDDPALFGAAYLIVDRLPGRPLIMGPDAGPSWMSPTDRQKAHEAAAGELAVIHRLDLSSLADWDRLRSPADEIALWTRAFERAADPDWTRAGNKLGSALLESVPERWTPGLCHGDFQTNNLLFSLDADGPAVGGVVDWEIAHFGAIEHDLAWFLMMNDDQAWAPVEMRGNVDLEAVTNCYESVAGRAMGDLSWFRALACYRIAAIAGYKIRLHRTGRKIDEAWERASSSMPFFFARADALLGSAA
ncbi:phosphotransferase family protein [Sphingobium sp. TB-6]|uniref:phosphotransferase family protein n=1 Tax=Sphingobium sp. TB-6 TaxID=2728850 RepID=UPI00146DC291|nr:phosphotransferase family protein [Sphingobium sp. TB-6]NML90629.1 phosphotransferase family protein [Sphingobium sp. TB-6]